MAASAVPLETENGLQSDSLISKRQCDCLQEGRSYKCSGDDDVTAYKKGIPTSVLVMTNAIYISDKSNTQQ